MTRAFKRPSSWVARCLVGISALIFVLNGALAQEEPSPSEESAASAEDHLTEPCGDFLAPSYRDLGLCSAPRPPVFDDPTTPDVDETQPDMSENHMKSVVYHNLRIGREIPQWSADISIGVLNALDQDPPYSYGLIGSRLWFNYDTNYEQPGRFGYLKVGFKF